MRSLMAAFMALALVGPAGAETQPGHIDNTYRFGGTFSTFEAASAESCEAACEAEPACKAWAFGKPRLDLATVCELKRTAGMAEAHPGFVSGISPRHQALFEGVAEAGELLGAPE